MKTSGFMVNLLGNRPDWKIKASIVYVVKYEGGKNLQSRTATSDKMLKRHVKELMESGILRENGHGKEVTEKTDKFLGAYRTLMSALGYREIRF